MSKKGGFFTQFIRHLIQFAAFILFPGLFISVFSAIRDILGAFMDGSFSFSGLFPQLSLVIMVFLVTALLGRFFCGFLCSFGMMQELLFFLFGRFLSKKVRIPERFDSVMKFLKFGIVIFITAGIWILALPVDSSWNPWGVFGMLVSGNLSLAFSAIPTAGFVLLMIIAIGSLVVSRFFCRYLCPLGALFALISGKRLYKIKRHGDSCTNCGLCTRTCSMGIHIPEKDAVGSGECIQCMQCLDICPKRSLSVRPVGAMAGIAAAAAICGAVIVGNLVSFPTAENGSGQPAAKVVKTEKGKYEDGIYIGEGEGFRGTTKVQVTVENGYISDIKVLSYRDDREFFQKAQTAVTDAILAEQTTDVSAVSGATFSSSSIMDAVADALGITSDRLQEPAGEERDFDERHPDIEDENGDGLGHPDIGDENVDSQGHPDSGEHGRGRRDGSGGGRHKRRQH